MVAASAEQIRHQLCYELKWMLRAVIRFEQIVDEVPATEPGGEAADSDVVALQDSALMHARNLVEFAKASSDPEDTSVQWALSDILGARRRKVPSNVRGFLNRWVLQLGVIGATETKWPKDVDGVVIDSGDAARLSRVVEVVFKLLEPKHHTTTLTTAEGVAYVELLDRAHEYFDERTPEAFGRLTCSGDAMPGA